MWWRKHHNRFKKKRFINVTLTLMLWFVVTHPRVVCYRDLHLKVPQVMYCNLHPFSDIIEEFVL